MATEEKLREYLKRATVDLTEARRRVAELEDGNHDPIAIVGMSCRYPGGATVEDYWGLLRDGRSGVVEVPPARWNVDDYYNPDRRVAGSVYTREGAFLSDIAGWDAAFFGISPQEALRMDPQQRLLMELLWEGLENAAISPAQLSGSRTGVLVGLMDNSQYGRLQVDRYGPGIAADPYFGAGVSTSVVAGRLAYQFDLRGPAITLDTACSSSLVGVHLAAQALRRGECDLAIGAGAFLIMQPDTYVQSCATSMLAADGRCKTFDSGADGYVMGEGGGLVVLERLSDAVRNGRRIRAVLRGSAVNQDGRSNGLSAPSRSAQVDVIRKALADARVEPNDVDYVEAHGSGTQLGDAIELSALHDVFGGRSAQRPLHVGAVKTNIGHTQSAAGVAGLIKTVLLLENGVAPMNLNFSEPAVATPQDGTIRPLTASVPFASNGRRKIAGVSGFGWSGTNGHLVIEAAPAVGAGEPSDAGPATYPLLVSAASDSALRAQLEQLSGWLGERPELDLADVAHTLSTGRAEHDHRRALVCSDLDDAVSRLAGAAADVRPARATARPRVAFLLPGIGDQYVGLGRELHRTEPVYAEVVDRCIALVDERCGIDLRPIFFPVADEQPAAGDFAALLGRVVDEPGSEPFEEPINQPEIAHPFLFIVEYALANLLAHRGVTPDVLVGYSLGEYVAACLAGVFSLEDALYIVVERARLIGTVPAGRMVAVAADEEAVRAAIRASGAAVDVAALNGPSMTVLSGVAKEIDAMAQLMTETGVACRPLRTTHAFHSSLLEPARDKLAALLDTVTLQAPTITIVSNRTGDPLTAEQATDRDYWADHLVNPVRFAQSVQHCVAGGVDVFIELGAGQTLGGLVRRNLGGASGVALLGTLPARWSAGEHPCARTELLMTCGRLWELGVGVDWSDTQRPGANVVTLPTYPFERTRFWPEPSEAAPKPAVSRPTQPTDLCYTPAWRNDGARAGRAALRLPGTMVIFADREGVGSALADRAASAGTSVIEVVAGTELRRGGRRIVIDPRAPEHYRELVSGLGQQGPLHVVHMWSLLTSADNPPYDSDAELRDSIRNGFDSLLLTVQAFGELAASQDVSLTTVSQGAVEILGGDGPAAYRAAVHGLGRVVRHEYAGITWRGVDLDPELVTADDAAAQLAHELGTEPTQPQSGVVGWRRARRWVQEWAEVATPADPEPVWRPDGVYLITGGTRGLGLALARHLVAQGVRRLALVSRTARGDIAALEAAGAEVLLIAADTGVPDQLRAALGTCREHFGALHGVVHAAGAPASGMVQRQTVAGAGAVLAPKVLAMGPLAELVGPGTPPELRPELLVLYSSAITVFGGIGEGDYCAANSVLDAYGAALSAAAPSTRVVSVAWGPWLHDDWQLAGPAGGLAEQAREYRERYGFPDDAGCALLDRIVQSGHGSVIAVRQPMQDALQEWSALLDIDALVGANPAAPAGERFPRPQLRTDFVAARTELEAVVAEVWGQYLGIDRVGIHDPFFDLGGNSLVGMAMVHAVENELDTHIAPAVLFEHPTVAEFAAALGRDETNDDGAGQARLVISSDRGQRRRRARAGVRK